MLFKTTKKSVQYTLGAILILIAALAFSAYRSGPVNNEHQTPGEIDPAQSVTTEDFHVKEANDLQRASNADSARWAAAEALYTSEQQNVFSQDTARWVAFGERYARRVEALSQDTARWVMFGESIANQTNDQQATGEAARWAAAEALYAEQINKQRSRDEADAARWVAIEALYANQHSARDADAARWGALASFFESHGQAANVGSPSSSTQDVRYPNNGRH